MEAELKALEDKIAQFVQLNQRLRAENMQLRQQLANVQNENKLMAEKMTGAKDRLEALLDQIPEDEA
jgi:cell division protein ZapB